MSSVAPGEPVPLATRAYWDDWYASKLAEEDAGDTPALEFEWLAGVGVAGSVQSGLDRRTVGKAKRVRLTESGEGGKSAE